LLVHAYPTQAIILAMDNASYHYSAPVRAALSLFAHRVRVFWLPQYCPELNLIERFWKHLKQTAWANKLYATIDSLRNNVVELLHLLPGSPQAERGCKKRQFDMIQPQHSRPSVECDIVVDSTQSNGYSGKLKGDRVGNGS
jgi:hypothetical protein